MDRFIMFRFKTMLAGFLAVSMAGQVAATVVMPRVPDTTDALERCPGGAAWMQADLTARKNERVESIAPNNPPLQAELIAAAESASRKSAEMSRAAFDAASEAAAAAAAAAAAPVGILDDGPTDTDRSIDASAQSTAARDIEPGILQLRRMIDTNGIPSAEEVGRDGQRAVWTLIKSAEDDPAFQLRSAEAFVELGAAQPVRGRKIAALIDFTLEDMGQLQRYGTRYQRDAAGRIVRSPVDDTRALVARRRALGMMPAELELCVRRDVDIDRSWLWLP